MLSIFQGEDDEGEADNDNTNNPHPTSSHRPLSAEGQGLASGLTAEEQGLGITIGIYTCCSFSYES